MIGCHTIKFKVAVYNNFLDALPLGRSMKAGGWQALVLVMGMVGQATSSQNILMICS